MFRKLFKKQKEILPGISQDDLDKATTTIKPGDIIYSFDKTNFPSNDEIAEMYNEKAKTTKDREVRYKIIEASMRDPRRSDTYFGSEKASMRYMKIAERLNSMTKEEFLEGDNSYKWLDEVNGKTK